MYQDIQFDMESYKNKVGVSQLMYNNKVRKSSGNSLGGGGALTGTLPVGGPVSSPVAIPHCFHPRHRGGFFRPRNEDGHPC